MENGQPNHGAPTSNSAVSVNTNVPPFLDERRYNYAIAHIQRARQQLDRYESTINNSHQRYLEETIDQGRRAQQMLQIMYATQAHGQAPGQAQVQAQIQAQAQAQVRAQAQAQSGSNAQSIQAPPRVASVHPGWFPPPNSAAVAVDPRGNQVPLTARSDSPRMMNPFHASAPMQDGRAFSQVGAQQRVPQFAHHQGLTQQHVNPTSHPPHPPGFPNPDQIPQGHSMARIPMNQASAMANYWETLGRITQAQQSQQQQKQQFNPQVQPHNNQTPYHLATTTSLDNALGNTFGDRPIGAAQANGAAPANRSSSTHVRQTNDTDGSGQNVRMQETQLEYSRSESRHVQSSSPPIVSLPTAELQRNTAGLSSSIPGAAQSKDALLPKPSESSFAIPVQKSIAPSNVSGTEFPHRETAVRQNPAPLTLQPSQPGGQSQDNRAPPEPTTTSLNTFANKPVRFEAPSESPIATQTGQHPRLPHHAIRSHALRPLSEMNSSQHTTGSIHVPGPSQRIPNLALVHNQSPINAARSLDPSLYRPFSFSNHPLPPNAGPAPPTVDSEAPRTSPRQRSPEAGPSSPAPVIAALSPPETPLKIRASPNPRTPSQADMRRLAKDIQRSLRRPGMQAPGQRLPSVNALGPKPIIKSSQQSQEPLLDFKPRDASSVDSQTTEVDMAIHNSAPVALIAAQDESLGAKELQPQLHGADAAVETSRGFMVGQIRNSLPDSSYAITQPTPNQVPLSPDGGQAKGNPVSNDDGEHETAFVGPLPQPPEQIVLEGYQEYVNPSHLPFPEPAPSQPPTVHPTVDVDIPSQRYGHLLIDDDTIANSSNYPSTLISPSFGEAPFDIAMEYTTSHNDQELELGPSTRIEEVIASPVQSTSGRVHEVSVVHEAISPSQFGPGHSNQSPVQERVRPPIASLAGPSQATHVHEVNSTELLSFGHTQETPIREKSGTQAAIKTPLFLHSPTPSPEPPCLPAELTSSALDVIDLTADSLADGDPVIPSQADPIAATATKEYTVISSKSSSAAAESTGGLVRTSTKRKRTSDTRKSFYILVPTPNWLRRKRRKAGGGRPARLGGEHQKSHNFTPEEQQILEASGQMLRERPCLWKDCQAVMNSGDNLFLHIIRHHVPTEGVVQCRWQDCNQVLASTGTVVEHHLVSHVLRVMPCPDIHCFEDFSDPIDLLQHNKRHQNDDRYLFKVTKPYHPIVAAEPEGIPTIMPSYQSVPRRISQHPMSRQDHDRIGQMVLRNIFAPVGLKLRKQNAPMRTRGSRLLYEQEGSSHSRPDEYDFLASLSSGPAKLMLADIDNHEVTKMCEADLVLWRGDDLCWNGQEEFGVAMENEDGTNLEGPDGLIKGNTTGKDADPDVIEEERDQTFARSRGSEMSDGTDGRNVGEEEDVALMLEP
ncbi:hypothetical protein CONPUDRAFT_143709 [Coniophora puteana RWD-64-598 SS2]|uniref:C2H2-type domain-containing protein n=1 Tax=Coniophora puteana (strain RWD-64-598) TaxID=741705 RepID=A0A5M3MT50_CONPW|nr:uncharacterized protein CONPUDRAFT_143709 [Coniophora puteana RWD-64-598 SS2]EIW82266.1 hypothetical protein CONPUDRAFT_143709 [Coniophora puteana RWD-64-598 SS2]